jgi:formylglycine-generating enzyme required for sulfatase activity
MKKPQTINLRTRKKAKLNSKYLIVIISAIIFSTIGIKAADKLFTGRNQAATTGQKCPFDMVFITSPQGGFCLDKYEASPGNNCLKQTIDANSDTRINVGEANCLPESKQAAIPWRYVSQDQASALCAKAGKRLPTNQEWLQAALGTPDKNDKWDPDDCQMNDNWQSQPGLTGSGKNCVSSAGVNDMVGNVWEWVQGSASDGIYNGKKLPPAGYIDSTDGESLPGQTNVNKPNPDYNSDYFWLVSSGLRAIARGGYWDNKNDGGIYSLYIVVTPSSAEPGIGFRCAK